MWSMILRIEKNKKFYAEVHIAREVDAAVAQAKDFERRFPAAEGFKVELYRWINEGQLLDFRTM